MRLSRWWEQTVAVNGPARLSREMIALVAAEKDGGAHVDANLPTDYVAMVEGVWTGTEGKVADHHLLYLRQMGWEILNSPALLALAA